MPAHQSETLKAKGFTAEKLATLKRLARRL